MSDTLSKLDYQPIIDSDDLELNIDVKWEGGPNRDFLNELDGKFDVQLGSGQLEEVEPGAGRVFGLLSIVALPRRLSLDFRDVIEKGFGFDEILGSFEVTKGRASTCNLSLKGPAADVGIIGSDMRAIEKTYNMLQQVSGRAGRSQQTGNVIIQTYYPEQPIIQSLQQRDRTSFIEQALLERKQ